MVRVFYGDDSYRGLSRFSYRQLHSFSSDDLAEALAAVDERRCLRLSNNLALVGRFCPAIFEVCVIPRESCDAVAVYSAEVCQHQNVGSYLSVLFWDSKFGPDSVTKLLEF